MFWSLGHDFEGISIQKRYRPWVNSISKKFYLKRFGSIVLGGGCFWCIEAIYLKIPGVLFATSGYAGGNVSNPSYEEVSTGETGHAEVVKVEFDKKSISLEKILKIFFLAHNPTTLNRQGNDVGNQYRSIILYTHEEDEKIIKEVMEEIKKEYKDPIVTEIKKLDNFFEAEDYHKNYYENNKNNAYCRLVIKPKLDHVLQEK
jgi:methionine-S-sulfoxide reductase